MIIPSSNDPVIGLANKFDRADIRHWDFSEPRVTIPRPQERPGAHRPTVGEEGDSFNT
jgi:hypothetical protein